MEREILLILCEVHCYSDSSSINWISYALGEKGGYHWNEHPLWQHSEKASWLLFGDQILLQTFQVIVKSKLNDSLCKVKPNTGHGSTPESCEPLLLWNSFVMVKGTWNILEKGWELEGPQRICDLGLLDDSPPFNGSKYESGEDVGDSNVHHVISPIGLVGSTCKIISVLECFYFPHFGHYL